jgi:Homing endonuclease associated repeat
MTGKPGVTVARLKLAARAAQMRAHGALQREIAAALGISTTYADTLLHDPDGSGARARKERYRRPCPHCGKPMSGSNGVGQNAPRRCPKCAAEASRVWGREEIVEAFQRFAEKFGRAPSAADLLLRSPSQREHASPERLAEADTIARSGLLLPAPDTVQRVFGSWNAAVRAAGLEPNATGTPGHRVPRPRYRHLLAMLETSPRSSAELVSEFGVDWTWMLRRYDPDGREVRRGAPTSHGFMYELVL